MAGMDWVMLQLLSMGLLLVQLCTEASSQSSCVKVNKCSCKFNSGRTLDLQPLDANPNFRFKSLSTSGEPYYYQYNPCTGVTCASTSGSVVSSSSSVCQLSSTSSYLVYDLGDASSATFTSRYGKLALKYTSLDTSREAYVSLTCDCKEEGRMVAKGVDVAQGHIFDMELFTKYACDMSCLSAGSGLSTGDILIILFLSLSVVYVVAGIAINKGVRKLEGAEILPNRTFWMALPGLVKEGFQFTMEKVRKPGGDGSSNNYQEIKS